VTAEIFVKQLDGCTYCSGGLNCTCASEAMWLYRATQERVHLTSCAVRTETGDRVGGTNLSQVDAVSRHHGVTTGRIYRPISSGLLTDLTETGRYGFIIQVLYAVISGTKYDCWSGRFKGNHAMYVSGPGAKIGTWRVADPGADGRRPEIPHGYQEIPFALMLAAAARLDIGGHPLGAGKAYAYLTPPDPVAVAGVTPHEKAITTARTALWNDSTKRWTFNGPNALPTGTRLEVRGRQYPKGGQKTYPVTSGPYSAANGTSKYAGYYVPVKATKLLGRV
jgi:hypothetical protein